MSSDQIEKLDLEILDLDQNVGYLPKPIPALRDREISDLLSRTIANSALATLHHRVEEGHAMVLQVFAERMATAAVRNKEPAFLRVGLTALLLTLAKPLMILPLYCDAVSKLHIYSSRFADALRGTVGDRMIAPFTEYMARADRSLKSMGYGEGVDADGFRYLRNW